MTAQDLNYYKSQIQSGNLNTQSVLQEIGEDLLFNPRIDPGYLVELDIFLRELHRAIYQNRKDLYTDEMRELLKYICAKASYAAENANDRKKGQKFYLEVQTLGQLLVDHAPNFQVIIGLIMAMNPQIKFWS